MNISYPYLGRFGLLLVAVGPGWAAAQVGVAPADSAHLRPLPPTERPGITVGAGSPMTIGEGGVVTTLAGDFRVSDGASLLHGGYLEVGGDFVVDGEFRTVIGGDDAAPRHGRVKVHGDAAYWGTLAVALERDARFTEARDFVLATQAHGDGQLATSRLPGARWSSRHSDGDFRVRLGDAATLPEAFSVLVDGARDSDAVVIDWVTYADERSRTYVVERLAGADARARASGAPSPKSPASGAPSDPPSTPRATPNSRQRSSSSATASASRTRRARGATQTKSSWISGAAQSWWPSPTQPAPAEWSASSG